MSNPVNLLGRKKTNEIQNPDSNDGGRSWRRVFRRAGGSSDRASGFGQQHAAITLKTLASFTGNRASCRGINAAMPDWINLWINA